MYEAIYRHDVAKRKERTKNQIDQKAGDNGQDSFDGNLLLLGFFHGFAKFLHLFSSRYDDRSEHLD